jgi:hypothetical protein
VRILSDRRAHLKPTQTWADLPIDIRSRLAGEGIYSASGWRALSRRRRRSIFGITPSMERAIDAAAGVP